jgi:SAM-dependent methyltransferase
VKFSYVTASRHYLDRFLSAVPFGGRVIDIGGKKDNKRGSFRPPMANVDCWQYVNLDASTHPDFLCDASAIPVPDASYDWVVLTEVLEHVQRPDDVLREAARVLKDDGRMVVTMPFLFPVHADPHDFVRWTPVKIRAELSRAGFDVQDLQPRGGVVAVILDLINVYYDGPKLSFFLKLFRVTFVTVAPAILFFDRFSKHKLAITTGYMVRAQKTKPYAV